MAASSATQEETLSKLIAAQGRLQKNLQTYRSRELDLQSRADLDHELGQIVARDRTGLRADGKIVRGGDTNAFLYQAEDLSVQQLEQRVRTLNSLSERIELRTPANDRSEVRRNASLEPANDSIVLNDRASVTPTVGARPTTGERVRTVPAKAGPASDAPDNSHRLDETELNRQAMNLLDPNNPDPRAHALLSRYKQVVAKVTEQADSARFVATRLLSTPQQTGLTDQEQVNANMTLAQVNRLQIIKPSALASRVTSNGSFINQAVVVRALKIESQGIHTLRDDTARTTNSELEHLGMSERYQSAVLQMDKRAGEIAASANAQVLDRSAVRQVSTGDLQMGHGLELPSPQ